MNYFNAMKAMSKGNKVRRASWPQEWSIGIEYLTMPTSEYCVMLNGTEYYTILAEDLEAEDWETCTTNTLRFGTLMLHGMPMPAPEKPFYGGDVIGYNGTDFEIGDTVEGKELTWLKLGNIWVCDRNIIAGISWDTLKEAGYVDGKEITIDGKRCRIRLMTGSDGSKGSFGKGCDNEWDQFMDKYAEEDKITHWKDMCTWCQEGYYNYSDCRSVRGYNSAYYYSDNDATYSGTGIAFRPVLELLDEQEGTPRKIEV